MDLSTLGPSEISGDVLGLSKGSCVLQGQFWNSGMVLCPLSSSSSPALQEAQEEEEEDSGSLCRLWANFVLNFPVEHTGICGVCDCWFGC